MSLNKEFFNRKTNITAKVICDSISEQGVRLTTFEIEYPRIVMSEFNTMRAISKNSSSSRAIPVSKMLEHTKSINLKPIYFGSKKSGMQAGDELVGEDLQYAKSTWESALHSMVHSAKILDEYRINGSSGATAKIAGILSTAKIKSVNSINIKTTNSGVIQVLPSIFTILSPERRPAFSEGPPGITTTITAVSFGTLNSIPMPSKLPSSSSSASFEFSFGFRSG